MGHPTYHGVHFEAQPDDDGRYTLWRNGDMVLGREFGADAARLIVEAADHAWKIGGNEALFEIGSGPALDGVRRKYQQPLHPPIERR